VEWRGTQTAAYAGWVPVLGAGLAVLGAFLVATTADAPGSALWPGVLCLAAGALIIVAGVAFGRLGLVLDATGVHLSFGPWRWPRRDVPWSAVRSADVADVRWLPWGGWGLRWRPGHGTAALLRQGPGVEFGLANGRVLVVTIDDAEAAVDAARAWLPSRPA
jgi:hypothetical protein